MSGFRDVVKGFFSTLFGVNKNPDDEFIFFWDEDDDTKFLSKQFSLSQTIKQNRAEVVLIISGLFILVSLIFNDNGNIFLSIAPLFGALVSIIMGLYYVQTNYKDPLNMINQSMKRLKEMDFSDSGELLYFRNPHESMENLGLFRSLMLDITSKLGETSINIMNSLFVVEDEFNSIQRTIDSVSSMLDDSGMNTANYQEIKYHANQISEGVDSFTTVFDQSLNSNEEVVSIVRSIGRQINMLALNAGIEAARAGELGIGFEVVSNNLRRLSQHAATTTTDMKSIKSSINLEARSALETITESMNQLVGNIDNSFTSANSINNELYQAKQKLHDLIENFGNLQHLVNTIGTELQQFKD